MMHGHIVCIHTHTHMHTCRFPLGEEDTAAAEAEEAAAESDSEEDWDLLAELLAPAKKNDSERRD